MFDLLTHTSYKAWGWYQHERSGGGQSRLVRLQMSVEGVRSAQLSNNVQYTSWISFHGTWYWMSDSILVKHLFSSIWQGVIENLSHWNFSPRPLPDPHERILSRSNGGRRWKAQPSRVSFLAIDACCCGLMSCVWWFRRMRYHFTSLR